MHLAVDGDLWDAHPGHEAPVQLHSDIQFAVQEIILTRTTPLNALKKLPCDWLIRKLH